MVASAASIRGVKASTRSCPNQDNHLIVPLGTGCLLAAVFDGHGKLGHKASQLASEMLEQEALALGAMSPHELPGALATFFATTHEAIVHEGFARLSGTTATVAVIDGIAGRAVVAHAGDSQMSVALGSEVSFATPDHRIDDDAAERLRGQGGEVVLRGGVARLYVQGEPFPGIAIARSLGDAEANSVGLLATPEIHEVALSAGCTIVIASDGVWDVLPPAEAAELLQARRTSPGIRAERLAVSLVEEARRKWSAANGSHIDDITAIVVQAAAGDSAGA